MNTFAPFRFGFDTSDLSAQIAGLSVQLAELKGLLVATKAEFAASIDAVTAHVSKVGDETRALIARINDLVVALQEAGNSSPEMDAALAALQAQVAIVDGLVPDA